MNNFKRVAISLVAISAVVLTGCSDNDNGGNVGYVLTEQGNFGTTSTRFENGNILENNGEVVGFLDLDGIVYAGNEHSNNGEACGGDMIGLCRALNGDEDFVDGYLVGECEIPVYDTTPIENDDGVVLYPYPAISVTCGEKI